MTGSDQKGVAVGIKVRRLLLQVARKWQDLRGTSKQIYFEDRVDQYRSIWRAIASRLDAEFVEMDSDFWRIRKGGRSLRIYQYQLELDDPVTLQLAGRKSLVHGLLAAAGIPVPEHRTFGLETLQAASELLSACPHGIVIKPASGYGGKGVTTHITQPAAISQAAILASLYDSVLLAEKQIAGECFRLLVFRGRVISAVRRSGMRIEGDGVSTIRQLIEKAIPRLSQDKPELWAEVVFTTGQQGLDLHAIPDKSAAVLISGVREREADNTELRTVYDAEVLESVCAGTVKAAEQAAAILGSDFLGVDIICTDITRPLQDTGGVVNELNTTPALHHHYDSASEPYPLAALTMISEMLGSSSASASL